MALFKFGKKKEEEKAPTCCCGGEATQEPVSTCCCGSDNSEATGACCCEQATGIRNVKVLGAGCKSCHEQYEYAKAAVANMGLSVEVEYITDMEKVVAYGVMSMPAIVVNETVVSVGKVLKAADVEKLLQKCGA